MAEGFYRLVTHCSNGSAMLVMKDVPFMLVPDYNIVPMIMSLVMMGKVMDKIFGPQVVTKNHQLVGFGLAFLLLAFLITLVF